MKEERQEEWLLYGTIEAIGPSDLTQAFMNEMIQIFEQDTPGLEKTINTLYKNFKDEQGNWDEAKVREHRVLIPLAPETVPYWKELVEQLKADNLDFLWTPANNMFSSIQRSEQGLLSNFYVNKEVWETAQKSPYKDTIADWSEAFEASATDFDRKGFNVESRIIESGGMVVTRTPDRVIFPILYPSFLKLDSKAL